MPPLPPSKGASSAEFALSTHMAGIFPICSFLHVPGKMRQPLWLSLGTAFLMKPPSDAFRTKTRGIALLTAAHVVVPWKYIAGSDKDTMTSEDYAAAAKAAHELQRKQQQNATASRLGLSSSASLSSSSQQEEQGKDVPPKKADVLSIPVDFRKSRNIIGKLYMPDPEGRAMKGLSFPLSVLSVHPTLDLCLLTVKDSATPTTTKGSPPSSSSRHQQSIEGDRFLSTIQERGLHKEYALQDGCHDDDNHDNIDSSSTYWGEQDSDMLKRLSDRFGLENVNGAGEHVRRWAGGCAGGVVGGLRGKGGLMWPSMSDTIRIQTPQPTADTTTTQSPRTRYFAVHDVVNNNQQSPSPSIVGGGGVGKKDAPKPDAATVLGFRGMGNLGTKDTLDPSIADNLTPAEKQAMQQEFQDVEGKQSFSTMGMRVSNGGGEGAKYGLGEVAHGEAYHGMSGGPVLSHSANQRLPPKEADTATASSSSVLVEPCYGLFYAAAPSMPALRAMLASTGNHTDIEPLQLQNSPTLTKEGSPLSSASTQRFAGYIPSPVILDWCRSMTPK